MAAAPVTGKFVGHSQGHREFLLELTPRRRIEDLVLPALTRQACDELIEEQHRAAVLRAHSLEPRHRVLLVGPPGNGKTSPATIAKALGAISYAEAEEFCRDVRRRSALAMEEQPLKLIVAERLKLWAERSRSMTNDGAEAQHLPPVCERSGKRGIPATIRGTGMLLHRLKISGVCPSGHTVSICRWNG